jgi:hypothetical protein
MLSVLEKKSKREREEIRRGRAEALTRRPTVNYGTSERDDRLFVFIRRVFP